MFHMLMLHYVLYYTKFMVMAFQQAGDSCWPGRHRRPCACSSLCTKFWPM